MTENLVRLDAISLSGPRSFFTDVDAKDPDYDQEAVKSKLKLQFLLKDRVVIAASSLFTRIGYELFSSEEGLVQAMEEGLVAPAIRNEFADPKDFFARYKHMDCPRPARDFFTRHTTHSVPWDLRENSAWFEETFRSHLEDPQSLLRQRTSMTESMAQDFLRSLDAEKDTLQTEYRYLRREHIYSVGSRFGDEIGSYPTAST